MVIWQSVERRPRAPTPITSVPRRSGLASSGTSKRKQFWSKVFFPTSSSSSKARQSGAINLNPTSRF